MSKKSFIQRVREGAAILDEKIPGWHNRINLEELSIQSNCDCILGQLGRRSINGGYTIAKRIGINESSFMQYGFQLPLGVSQRTTTMIHSYWNNEVVMRCPKTKPKRKPIKKRAKHDRS